VNKNIGVVTAVVDGLITVAGLPYIRMGEVVLIQPRTQATRVQKAETKIMPKVIEKKMPIYAVVISLERNLIRALLLNHLSDVREKYFVYRQYRRLSTIVGDKKV
jgi:hypothetical protein